MENDLINRQAAINEIMDDLKDTSLHDDPATPEDYAEGYDEGNRNAAAIVLQMPSAQPDNRLERIADIVEGTIDHLDRDDAMDMLYQIKEVLK